MKIAVAAIEGQISQHFGHCDGYEIYIVDNKKIMEKGFLKYPGHKPGFLPKYLSEKNVDLIIAGGMGSSAKELFRQKEIDVIVGVEGSIEAAVRGYLDGTLGVNETDYENN